MAGTSSIEWTDRTWNPIVGCQIVSPGCTNCYAMKMAARLEAMNVPHYQGVTRKVNGKPVWTGVMRPAPDTILTAPLRWREPRRIFVNSMSDLFGEGVTDEQIDRVFAVMALTPQHTYQVLTKRAARMRAYIETLPATPGKWDRITEIAFDLGSMARGYRGQGGLCARPLPNVWLGVSAEDQTRADERIPQLLATPAAVRFVSAEPLLSDLDIRWALSRNLLEIGSGFQRRGHFSPGLETLRPLDLVIVGGESGPGARPCWTPHIRSIVRQCTRDGAPVFVKQLGAVVQDRNDAGFDGMEEWCWPDMDPADVEEDERDTGYQGAPVRVRLRDRKGGDMAEWPEDLRIRQMAGRLEVR